MVAHGVVWQFKMLYGKARCCAAVSKCNRLTMTNENLCAWSTTQHENIDHQVVQSDVYNSWGKGSKTPVAEKLRRGAGATPFYVKTNSVKKFVKFDTATSCDIGTQTWDQLTQLVELKFLRKQIFSWSNSILKFVLSLPGRICSDRPKYFPWLTFNFRLRTGHKSGLGYLKTPNLVLHQCCTTCSNAVLQCNMCEVKRAAIS